MASKKELIDQLEAAKSGGTLSEESLAIFQRLLEISNDSQINAASLINEMVVQPLPRTERTEKLLEYYRKIYEYKDRLVRYPQHKVEWFMEALELILNAFEMAQENTISNDAIYEIVAHSGIFEKRYVDPAAQAQWDNENNWREEKGYQGQTWREFVGSYSTKQAVLEHSRFSATDLRTLVFGLITDHVLEPKGGGLKLIAK